MKTSLPKAMRELAHEFTRLPGIGPKTAQRLAIHLYRQQPAVVKQFAKLLDTLHEQVQTCKVCFGLSEQEVCTICRDEHRDGSAVCVVEDSLDVDAIERTGSYRGRYHVLGGVLSPLEGVGAEQLTLRELTERVAHGEIKELIIALDHNMESEATSRYIVQSLDGKEVSVTRLARGLPTGGDIEFADAMTLNAAFEGRKRL